MLACSRGAVELFGLMVLQSRPENSVPLSQRLAQDPAIKKGLPAGDTVEFHRGTRRMTNHEPTSRGSNAAGIIRHQAQRSAPYTTFTCGPLTSKEENFTN